MQLTIEIQMIHRPTLEKLAQVIGGHVACSYEHRRGRRTQWRWRLTDEKAEKSLRLILPYMITKLTEAKLALELRETRNHGRQRKPQDVLQRRQMLRGLMAEAKAIEFSP